MYTEINSSLIWSSFIFTNYFRLSGIECRKVQGHVKGAGYLPGQTFTPNLPNHEWNAVLLDGSWYLVDVCWSSGYLHQVNKQFVFKFSEHYFFTDPEVFVEDHLPLETSWQLMDFPRNLDDFQESVHFKQGFFQYGIQEISPGHGFVQVDKEVDMSITFSYPLTLTYELKHLELDKEFSKCVNFCVDNTRADFCIRPPTTGIYTFKLYGKMRGCKDEPVALTTHTLDVVRVCPVAPSWRDLRFPWGPTRYLTHYSLEEVGLSRSCLTLDDGVCESTFKYNSPTPVVLKPLLYKASNGKLKSCESKFSVVSKGLKSNHVVVRTRPPSSGHYWLSIYAATPEGAWNESCKCVANYMICSRAPDLSKGGKVAETTRWKHDCQDYKAIFISPPTSGKVPMENQTSLSSKKAQDLGNISDSGKALATVGFARMGFGGIGSLANLLILLCARIRDQSHRGYLRLLRFVIDWWTFEESGGNRMSIEKCFLL